MKLKWILLTAFVSAQIGIARAQDAAVSGMNSDIDALKKEIQALEQKVDALEQQKTQQQSTTQVEDLDQHVRILERKREIDEENAAATAKTQPKISVGPDGVKLSSADTNFVFNLHGLVQLDSRNFYNAPVKGVDGFILRRARPIFTGTVYHDFDFNLTPDFGGNTVQVLDAYANYRNRPEFQVQAGKFKSPVSLEQLQSDPVTAFNERSLVNDLVPNRDLGADVHGDLFGGVASYAAGIFNGAPDYSGTTTNSDYDNNKAFVGRVFFQPFKPTSISFLQGFGFGIGGSYEADHGSATGASGLTSGYTTDGQQKFFTYTNGVFASGTHWRLDPQANYYWGPLCVAGEYVISDQQVAKGAAKTDLRNRAWDVTAGWVLTGESASYTGITPAHPFDPRKGQWGAVQIVGRYADLDVDNKAFPVFANPNTAASSAHAWSAGVNWFLNKNIRVNASYSHTIFAGGNGTGATVTKNPEDVFFTRVQLVF